MKRWRFTARIALVALAALIVLELALRVVAHVAHRERALVFDRDLGWRQRPNLTKVGHYWSASEPTRLNSRGWRDRERSFDKPAGTRRIVALGDSFTFGAMVDVHERFTDRLESSLSGVEVVNLGISAFSPDQELRLLEIEGLRYEPDVVLVQLFLGNDLDDVRFQRRFTWPKPYYELVDGELRFHPARWSWDVALHESSYLGHFAFKLLDRRFFERDVLAAPRNSDTLPLSCAIVVEMDRLAREHGAHLLVLPVPDPAPLGEPVVERERLMVALFDRAGLAILDPREPFAERRRAGEQLESAPDHHWNAAGHALAAQLIAEELERRGWLR